MESNTHWQYLIHISLTILPHLFLKNRSITTIQLTNDIPLIGRFTTAVYWPLAPPGWGSVCYTRFVHTVFWEILLHRCLASPWRWFWFWRFGVFHSQHVLNGRLPVTAHYTSCCARKSVLIHWTASRFRGQFGAV